MADDFKSSKPFFDTKNYPRGFARSGDYTITEAKILEEFGKHCLDLETGTVKAKTKKEKDFLKALKEPEKATSVIEKTWLKYRKLIAKSKIIYTLSETEDKEIQNQAE